MNIFNFIEQTLLDGGCSYNPEFGISPKKGYMVSIRDAVKCNPEDIENAVHQALKENGGLLVDQDNFLGSWISDDGQLYIDIARNVQDLRHAIRIGMEHDQLAIYDLNKGCDINLKGRQKCGTEIQKGTYMELAIEETIRNHESTQNTKQN